MVGWITVSQHIDLYFEKDLHKLGGTAAKADPPLCHEKKEETQMNAVVLLVVGVAILVAGYSSMADG